MTDSKQSFTVRVKQLADGWVHPINTVPKGVLLLMAVCMAWLLLRPGAMLSEPRLCVAVLALGIFYLVAIYGLCLRGVSAIAKDREDGHA